MKKSNNRGFTLVELLVVIAIIGILAVVAVPALFTNINKAKVAKVESDYNALKSAVLMYYAENNALAQNINNLNIDGMYDFKETPIGGKYSIRYKGNDNKIADAYGNRTAAHKLKANGDFDDNPNDEDKDGKRIYIDNYGDTFLSIQGHKGTELYINKKQFSKLVEDIGYENIFISSKPTGPTYQTSEIYIRLANNILPKPIISKP